MVKKHRSVRSYVYDGNEVAEDHLDDVNAAIEGVRRLIAAACYALQDDNIFNDFSPYFQRYFGASHAESIERVRKALESMRKLIDSEDEYDITIRVGTRHLSHPTEVYIPGPGKNAPCIVDFSSLEAFAPSGAYDIESNALFPTDADLFEEGDMEYAFVLRGEEQEIGFVGGRDIFINPTTMQWQDFLAPFESGRTVQEGDSFRSVYQLPAALFHEFCHTTLLGPPEDRLKDIEVIPNNISPNVDRSIIMPTSENAERNPDKETCLYGDGLCGLAARSQDPNIHRDVLRNAESYTLFALACYMRLLGWDYASGAAVSLDAEKTSNKTLSELTAEYGVVQLDHDSDSSTTVSSDTRDQRAAEKEVRRNDEEALKAFQEHLDTGMSDVQDNSAQSDEHAKASAEEGAGEHDGSHDTDSGEEGMIG